MGGGEEAEQQANMGKEVTEKQAARGHGGVGEGKDRASGQLNHRQKTKELLEHRCWVRSAAKMLTWKGSH